MERYRKVTDMLRARLVDVNLEIFRSREEFRRQPGECPDDARGDRHAPLEPFIQCAQNWCSDRKAASTLSLAFIRDIRDITDARMRETARQIKQTNRTAGDIQSDTKHKDFTAMLLRLADMFATTEERVHPRAPSLELEEHKRILPLFNHLFLEGPDAPRYDSDSSVEDEKLQQHKSKSKKKQPPHQPQPSKATKVMSSAPAPAHATISPRSLDIYLKNICEQEAAALAIVKRYCSRERLLAHPLWD
jgi:hypothetical protein